MVSFYDTEKDGDDEGFLVAYELTDFDWKIAENWKRHVLADSFTTNFFIFGNTMSPGKHRTFYPSRYYCKSSTEMKFIFSFSNILITAFDKLKYIILVIMRR